MYPTVMDGILYLLPHLHGRAVLLGSKVRFRSEAGCRASIATDSQVVENQRVHLAIYKTTSKISIRTESRTEAKRSEKCEGVSEEDRS